MRIGILQTGKVSERLGEKHGQYPDMFARLLAGHGLSFTNFPVLDEVFPAGVEECDGWLITGSAAGVYEDRPWIAPLEQFIREGFARQAPFVGICFGHQIMAQALGGKVVKFSGGWNAGRKRYELAGGGALSLNALHQDQVVELPPQARVTATNDSCRYAALVYEGGRAISWQPHPEFADDFLADLLAIRRGTIIPAPVVDAAIESLVDTCDAGRLASEIADFFHESRERRAA